MTPITYTWKVESVDTNSNTFVVEYTPTEGVPVRLNLQLPGSIDQIPSVVEAATPRQILIPVTALPDKTLLDPASVLSMSGTVTTAPGNAPANIIDANEMFKKQVATALFELGITPTNMYVAPVNTATTATITSPGTAPTVIG